MREKRVLIIEDNSSIRHNIERLVREVNQESAIYSFSNTPEAYKVAMETAIDVFLVDIMLDSDHKKSDLSGIRFAERIRTRDQYRFTPIIFITALQDPKMHVYYHIHCYSYIEKPFDEEEVKKQISGALHYTTEKNEKKYVYFKKDGILYPVQIGDIIYIENRNHKLNIHTIEDRMEIPYRPCEDILKELDSPEFLQCSRNTIINRKFIKDIDPSNRYIGLKNIKEPIEIGPVYKKCFLESIGI